MPTVDALYRLRYFNAFALILASATGLRAFDMLGSVEYASLIGGAFLTLCGGGAFNTRAQAPAKVPAPAAGGSEP